jgi:hypothetical protein
MTMGWTTVIHIPAEIKACLFVTKSRLALGLNKSPIHWVLVAISLGIKEFELEFHHSSLSSIEI